MYSESYSDVKVSQCTNCYGTKLEASWKISLPWKMEKRLIKVKAVMEAVETVMV